jgi:uncharacterized protein YqjF (DUF2071 family)
MESAWKVGEEVSIEARLRARERTVGKPDGWQAWRELLFVHWEVDVASLRALIPAELELDLWEGRAFVGVVPFAMHGVRPSWLPRGLAMDFLETNVRAYVSYRGEPGVYFFSLEAASWLAVQAARWGWGLPYHYARMEMGTEGSVRRYETLRRRGAARLEVEYRVGQKLGASEIGSAAFFFLERYLLFSLRRGRVMRGQVQHLPYPVQGAELISMEETLLGAAGLEKLGSVPSFVHYSPGVDVEVFGPHAT